MEVKMTKQDLRDSRILAMQILYHYDMTGEKKLDTIEMLEKKPNEFTMNIVEGVLNNLEKIDQIIENNLKNYTLDRLSYVDRALVRASTYEFISKTPPHFVISEALEIVKEYSDSGDGKNRKFIHSLVDNIYKSL